MKKRLRILAFILGMTLCTSACTKTPTNEGDPLNTTVNSTGKKENTNQSKLDVLRPPAYGNVKGLNLEPGSYISIIGRNSNDSYWKEVEAGAKRAVADINDMLGYKGDDKIKLSFIAPDVRDDVNEQINILDEELDRYPIAIGIAAIDTTACHSQFELAADNGIPIVTFDSGTEYSDIVAHISTDNIEAAETAALKTANLMEDAGEVAVFVQDSFSMTAKQREQGFVNTITEKYPNIKVVNIYHMDQLEKVAAEIAAEQNALLTEGDPQVDPATITQKDVVKYILEKNPKLKAVYATNLDTTQLVANVLTDLKRDDLHFVGFDAGKEQQKLLTKGIVDGIIVQNPYGIGYATVVAAARHVLELGNEAFVDSGYTWVTKNNMEDEEIKGMLY